MKIPVVSMNHPQGADEDVDRKPTVGDVCLACGLCCSGVLFTEVTLHESEAERLLARDATASITVQSSEPAAVAENDSGKMAGMDQPCGFLSGSRCTVYTDRPAKCRKFNCTLIKKIDKKDISISDALSLVAVAKQHVAQIEAGIPAWMEYSEAASKGGVRLKLYEVKRALAARHIKLMRLQAQVSVEAQDSASSQAGATDQQTLSPAQISAAFASDYDLAYRILNYLRFMAEYFHESSLLASYEKLVRAQTFVPPESEPATRAESVTAQ